jgi:hypothetical protein
MAEETYSQTYRGFKIYYYRSRDAFGTPLFPGLYADEATIKERIDLYYEAAIPQPEPEKREIYVAEYRDCDIYYYPAKDKYGTPCVPLVFDSLLKIRYEIDKLREAEKEAPPTPPEEPVKPPEEPPKPPEEPTFELPALPWYAAWLKPVLEFIGALAESIVNFFAPIFDPIKDVASNIIGLPSKLVDDFVKGVGSMLGSARDTGAGIAVDTISQVAEGTPAWMTTLSDELEKIYSPILKGYAEAADVATYEHSVLEGEEAVKALEDMKGKVLATAIINFGLHALVESGSLGQFEFMKELDTMVTSKFGMDRLIERATMLPLEKAVLIPAEYEYNKRYPVSIPTYTDLITMVVKEVIKLDRFKAEMLKLGFKEEWAQYIWDAHFKPPDWTDLRSAYYRGAITPEQLMSFKVLVDLDPRYDVVWDNLIEQIPPYSELVNELVKEVIDRPTFTKYMKWYGFDEAWAKRIWDAHFIPPAQGDLLTAWRRGLITEDRLDSLMVLVDLDPRFKDIFDTRKYIDPGIRTGRYMFEAGAIDRDRVKQIVQREGYAPDDVEPIVEFLTTFQEREFRTSYLRALATGTIYGAYTEEELRKEVKAAGYSDAVADWMLKIAEVREKTSGARKKAPGPKLLTEGNLKRAYVMDYITEDVLRTELGVRGYPVGDVDILVRLLTEEKVTEQAGGQKLALSQSELLNAMRYNEMSEDQVRIELQLRGLTPEETDVLIRTKRKQWGEAG